MKSGQFSKKSLLELGEIEITGVVTGAPLEEAND